MNSGKKFLIVLLGFGALAGAGLGYRAVTNMAPFRQRHGARYYCPMHPAFISDRPGDCPICGMALKPVPESGMTGGAAQAGGRASRQAAPNASAAGGAAGGRDKARLKSVCVLHKCTMAGCVMELTLLPGERRYCPVCKTFVEGPGAAGREEAAKPLYYRHPHRPEITSPKPVKDEMGMDFVPVYAEPAPAGTSGVEGQAALLISAERQQMIGMKSAPVEKRDLAAVVRASGRVAYDPDLFNAIAEYREAARARERVQESPWPDVKERAQALVDASSLKLRQMGLTEAQIAEAARSPKEPTNLLLGGKGGSVWVYAQIYEYEIGLVKPGQTAEIETPAYPGRKFKGAVRSVDPILSAETRTLKVRIEVPNQDGALKLEMFVNARIRAGLGRKLAIPEEAVVDAGERKIAFVDLGQGRIEPREIRTGNEAEGYYELISGVKEGERVVTSANFLIDSESRLKAAMQKAAAGR